jgi:hypothetical protein
MEVFMPQISLTDFVDIVSASGTPKATKVKEVKRRPPYQPSFDFYKQIRDGIVEAHQNRRGKTHLDGTLPVLTDRKKVAVYPSLVASYKKWWGRKDFVWFIPPNVLYSRNGIDISINPELGLEINGIPHLIKLYFKGEPLAKNKIDIITHLMAVSASPYCPQPGDTIMSVLDIRRQKLFTPTVPIPSLSATLNAELAYISALWPSV